MNKNKRYKILNIFYKDNIFPTTELIFSSAFECLISVILSAKSKDISVNRVTKKLYLIANTPQLILSLGIENLKNYIKQIGLYNNKANNIINTCHMLLKKHEGKVPNNRIDLEQLPGVGRKTANVVLNLIFHKPTIAVDTHVFRVSNRTGFAVGKTVTIVEKKLLKIIPNKFKLRFHSWFVYHGRYICKSYKPYCKICVIQALCEFKNKNI
ncbi:MAG TPA: endonuclease III [Buchnera sp. (in: enterobacteria)]|nr:endonuclease III [Buchnera sp. (in: enterobacteria)]